MLRFALLALTALAACGPTATNRAQNAIANQAGQNCIDHGGQLIVRVVSGGQKAYCELPGRTIDALEFFRQTNP